MRIFSLIFLFFSVGTEIVYGSAANGDGKKFNAGDFIVHHIKDAYDWHITTIGSHDISIPLPVILFSPGNGFDIFLSNRFEHGKTVVNGYRIEHNHIIAEDGRKFYDISITKNVASLFISVFILLFIFIKVARSYLLNPNKPPRGLVNALEPVLLFIRDDIAKPSIGAGYEKYLPYLMTVFFFIWINNMLGLIPIFPGGANLTGNIATTLVLALFTFIISIVVSKKYFWLHIFNPPGVPIWLKLPIPLMPVVEFMGVIIRPSVLMIRLFANILAGHIIILSFISLIFIFAAINTWLGLSVSAISIAFSVFMSFLELLVAFIQAYVFTILSAIYFGMATEVPHHNKEHH
ncbi:MAG: F0F1 ATP synthase subunit A [Bacteroidetes bacterium]|nr:F0F1 ATP synthase subunit A [Bacteroidota bacterium]